MTGEPGRARRAEQCLALAPGATPEREIGIGVLRARGRLCGRIPTGVGPLLRAPATLFFGYFLLARQKKVTSCRATPGDFDFALRLKRWIPAFVIPATFGCRYLKGTTTSGAR